MGQLSHLTTGPLRGRSHRPAPHVTAGNTGIVVQTARKCKPVYRPRLVVPATPAAGVLPVRGADRDVRGTTIAVLGVGSAGLADLI